MSLQCLTVINLIVYFISQVLYITHTRNVHQPLQLDSPIDLIWERTFYNTDFFFSGIVFFLQEICKGLQKVLVLSLLPDISFDKHYNKYNNHNDRYHVEVKDQK